MRPSSISARDLRYIIRRNVLLLTNGIIFSVVVLLFAFGEVRAGIFLGVISVMNIAFGLGQDIRAWIALQKLQLMTAPQIMRIRYDGQAESVSTEEIAKGDLVRLKTGDQIPCDAILLEATNFEINEGLITGESDSLPRRKDDKILAGSIVTSGTATARIETVFRESRIARMTEGVKKYSANASPIQRSVDMIIRYAGYILLVAIVFIVARSLAMHQAAVKTVLDVATLTSMLVPQGLVFAVTLFFAYGAANLFRKNVLLQEVNATEKLGRIKNLCMDKTGTITQNVLSVKDVLTPGKMTREAALELAAAYIKGSGDSSQTIDSIKRFIGKDYEGEITGGLPFSSWRQYGAARIPGPHGKDTTVYAGPAQVFESHIQSMAEKKWLKEAIEQHSHTGERMLCFMRSTHSGPLSQLKGSDLAVVGLFVFYNDLREGIRDTIGFFQERGVRIRIISGDNPETASAVAAAAGINHSDAVVTGTEMLAWKERDYEERVKDYSIFASILPEQKKRIVEAFKRDGFTAMIGDGANDALAIKAADLGIAMFDGAPVVRQLASVVLTNNSFAALPGGVELADNIIRYIEMFAAMFLSQSIIGLLFFLVVAVGGHQYPLTPFNITLINYFVIGMPGLLISYWVVRPVAKVLPADTRPFERRVLPIALFSAIAASAGAAAAFFLSLHYAPTDGARTLVVLALIAFSFAFFVSIPRVYQGAVPRLQKVQLACLGILELIVLAVLFHIPIAVDFFNVTGLRMPYQDIGLIVLVLLPFCIGQYAIARYFPPAEAPKN